MWDRLGGRWWMVLLGGAGLSALAGIMWLAADSWWLHRLSPAAAVTIAYRRLRRYGQRLAVPTRSGDTPYEFASSFVNWLAGLERGRRWKRVLEPAAQEIHRLTDFYVRISYTSHRPDSIDRAGAIIAWQGLRWRLWLARLRWGKTRDRQPRHGHNTDSGQGDAGL